MSAASMQHSCAACGGSLREDNFRLEVLIDAVVRYVAVHITCSIYRHNTESEARNE